MMNTDFDIIRITKNLIKSEIKDKHAKAIAKEISHIGYNRYPKHMLKVDLDRIVNEMEIKLERLKSEILKWYIGVAIIQMTGVFIMVLY